jgi:RHS repeat-associated protein
VTIADGTGAPLPLDASGYPHSAIGNAFTFTGQQLEESTELYFFHARYYHAALGRFLQRDPMATPPEDNFYAYVNGQPTKALDPLGLYVIKGKCDKIGPFDLDLNKFFKRFKIDLPLEASISVSAKICACCETTTDKRDIIVSGTVSGKATTPTVDVSVPFTIWIIPMTVEIQGNLTGSVSITGEYNGCSGVDRLSGGGSICADLKGSLQAGVKYANVGVYGSVEACVNAKASGSAKHAKAEIWGTGSGEIGVWATLAWKKWEKVLLSGSASSPHTVVVLW